MFLENVYRGNSDIPRWIAMILILIIMTQIIGGLPLILMMFLKTSDEPGIMPNPENLADLSVYGIDPNMALILMVFPFLVGVITFWILMKPIHERPFLSLITSSSTFRWKNFFWGAGVWIVLLSAYALIATLTGIQKNEIQFNASAFFVLVIVSLLFIPFQAGFEELLFRGYLMQGFGKLFRNKWSPILITAVIFGSLHLFNPEVEKYGIWATLPQYLWLGLFLGICTLMDEGLEISWGIHAANNIFLSLFFTQDGSVMPTPALFRIVQFNSLSDTIGLLIISAIFFIFAAKKFGWAKWTTLLGTITPPMIEEEEENFDFAMEKEEQE